MNSRRKLLLGLSVLWLSACKNGGSSNSGAEQDQSEEVITERIPSILVLGDSIAQGVHASFSFPDILAGLSGLPVVNHGIPGASAEADASNLPQLIDQFNPTIIVSLLGTNNANNNNGGGVQGAIDTALYITRVSKENDIIPILGTLPPIVDTDANRRAAEVSDGIRRIGGARIADVRAAMNLGHIGSDGLHPNDTGQRIIAEVFNAQLG